jgi:hypothetical protein
MHKGGMFTLANHWLVTYRGGGKVLDKFCLLFTDALLSDLFSNHGGGFRYGFSAQPKSWGHDAHNLKQPPLSVHLSIVYRSP